MSQVERRYSTDECVERGQAMYDARVKPLLTPADDHKYVAVDVDTGEYEIDASDYEAAMRLQRRRPSAEIMLLRAGHATTVSIGYFE